MSKQNLEGKVLGGALALGLTGLTAAAPNQADAASITFRDAAPGSCVTSYGFPENTSLEDLSCYSATIEGVPNGATDVAARLPTLEGFSSGGRYQAVDPEGTIGGVSAEIFDDLFQFDVFNNNVTNGEYIGLIDSPFSLGDTITSNEGTGYFTINDSNTPMSVTFKGGVTDTPTPVPLGSTAPLLLAGLGGLAALRRRRNSKQGEEPITSVSGYQTQ